MKIHPASAIILFDNFSVASFLIDQAVLLVFIPTFFLVSATPGMCMTLALTLGMTVGIRKTMWMMWGELAGVAIVSTSAVLGVAAVMLNYPSVFEALKYAGGLYLLYIGIQMWRSKGKMAVDVDTSEYQSIGEIELMLQGLVTAVANPKGWAFSISLLPPFISSELALLPQLLILIGIILCSEFICMMIYASGGKTLKKLLHRSDNVRLLNRISGSLMIGVAIWLALG